MTTIDLRTEWMDAGSTIKLKRECFDSRNYGVSLRKFERYKIGLERVLKCNPFSAAAFTSGTWGNLTLGRFI